MAADGPSALERALLDPARLLALRACDAKLLRYNPHSFASVLNPRGRNLRMLGPPLLTLGGAYSALAALLTPPLAEALAEWLEPVEGYFIPLLTSTVAFLLVFRIGRAAVRFWDARAAAGDIILNARTLSAEALMLRPADDAARADLARWMCAMPVAIKNHLRALADAGPAGCLPLGAKPVQPFSSPKPPFSRATRLMELVPALSAMEAAAVLDARNPPLLVAVRVREAAARVLAQARPEHVQPLAYRGLADALDRIAKAAGTMERIANTPLPFVYVAHLRTFLLLFLAVAPLPVFLASGWAALAPALLAAWAMLGIEAAAVECEAPFLRRANHLGLGALSITVARDIAQVLRDTSAAQRTPLVVPTVSQAVPAAL